MNKIKLSIIVPIYNVENYLRKCLDSILNQDLNEIEVILVDDASPDNCPQICEEYEKKDSRIKVIHKKNEGLGLARNTGLEVATGEYVYFIDSDDYLVANCLKKMYLCAVSGNCDAVFGGVIFENENGITKKIENQYLNKVFFQPDINNIILKDMLGSSSHAKTDRGLGMSVWQGIYKLELIKKNKILFYSEREYLSEDILFQISFLTKSKKICWIDDYSYVHLMNNNYSLTNKYNEKRFSLAKVLLEKIEQDLKVLNLDDSFLNRARRTFFGNVRVCLKQIINVFNKKEALIKIKKIVDDDYLQYNIQNYPIKNNPLKQRLLMWSMKKKYINVLYFLVFINSKKYK